MKSIKSITTTALMLMITFFVSAQETKEYNVAVNGKLYVNGLNRVTFEGHSGSDVIISTQVKSSSKSERAEGLKLINGLGLEDNTGLGLSVNKTNDGATVDEISSRSSRRYVIKVPKSVRIVYEHNSVHGSKVVFNNIAGEIEAKTNHSGVELNDVTGPLMISTVHGKVEGEFKSVSQEGPVSVASAHGLIDLAIPIDTKADLKLSTSWGEIYSDLSIDVERSEKDMRSYSANDVKGKLNGGGVFFDLRSTHGNIYLRKK